MQKRLALGLILFLSFKAVSAAATFRDAVKAMGPGNSGGNVARELVTLLNTMSEKLRYDAKAQQFFVFMNDALEDFDFARIYESPWLTPAQDNFRSITLSGRNSGDAYTVSVSPAATDFSHLGNARAEYRMRRNEIEGDKTYTAQLAFDAALKQFEAQGMARLIRCV